jgi:hypothetical protein
VSIRKRFVPQASARKGRRNSAHPDNTEHVDDTLNALGQWLRAYCSAHHRELIGTVEIVKERPWATVITANTSRGRVFAKANCHGLCAEGPLLHLLAEWVPEAVIGPLAIDGERGFVLVPDGGPTIFATNRVEDITVWAPVLANLAAAQRATMSHVGRVDLLLEVGVPDFRPHLVAERLELLGSEPLLGQYARRIAAVVPGISTAAAQLDADSIGWSVSHGDLQPNNMLAPPTSKPFDWGDAVVAHPFCTLTSLRWSIDNDDLYVRLRHEYLTHWADVANLRELVRVAHLAELVGCVAAIWTWVRVGPAAIALHPHPIPMWLERIEQQLQSGQG